MLVSRALRVEFVAAWVEGGDWWRTDFFFNITVAELIGDKLLNTPRVQELIDIMRLCAAEVHYFLMIFIQ